MIIEKKFTTFGFDKNGSLVDISAPNQIHIDVKINTELSTMCKDLLNLIKDDDVFSISITHAKTGWVDASVKKSFFDLEYVKEIVFEDYYLRINGLKIFYNAIFDFKKEKRW